MIIAFSQISAQEASPTNSTPVNICTAFYQLTEKADSSFTGLVGEITDPGSLLTEKKSLLRITDSQNCLFRLNTFGDLKFIADYGIFSTEADAQNKVTSLFGSLKNCFNTLSYSISYDALFKERNFHIFNVSQNGIRVYTSYFKISSYKDGYHVDFIFEAGRKADFWNSVSKPSFKDFIIINSQTTNDDKSLAIRKVLEETSNKFANIKEEKTDSRTGYFDCYKTNLIVPGFIDCFIEDRTLNILNYTVICYENISQDQAKTKYDEIAQILFNAMGKDYAFSSSPDGLKVDFVSVKNPQNIILTFLVTPKDGKFEMRLQFQSK